MKTDCSAMISKQKLHFFKWDVIKLKAILPSADKPQDNECGEHPGVLRVKYPRRKSDFTEFEIVW